ncbi:MAG: GNAT family acetyltransferase [Promethearchaeota archaeon]|jgi:N-acetylglutamate synthase-like GNAT family acetyltransferase|nr:MAG: GNAT family acetyltransferase [Candidatus Lokiarchaeota archaeon]
MKICPFRSENARDVSNLIRKTLSESNRKYYPKSVIKFLSDEYSSEHIKNLSKKIDFFIALDGKKIVGVVGLEKNYISSVFVLPKFQKKGVGKDLMKHVEKKAQTCGHKKVNLNSSINALDFYKKIGYELGNKVEEENYGITYEMSKRL